MQGSLFLACCTHKVLEVICIGPAAWFASSALQLVLIACNEFTSALGPCNRGLLLSASCCDDHSVPSNSDVQTHIDDTLQPCLSC